MNGWQLPAPGAATNYAPFAYSNSVGRSVFFQDRGGHPLQRIDPLSDHRGTDHNDWAHFELGDNTLITTLNRLLAGANAALLVTANIGHRAEANQAGDAGGMITRGMRLSGRVDQ